MKTIQAIRLIFLTLCCSLFAAADISAQRTPEEDRLDFAGYQATFHHTKKKANKFFRCFKTASARRLDSTEVAVSYDALLDLRQRCVTDHTGIAEGQHIIYGFAIYYGLSENKKVLRYIFEPLICVITTQDPDQLPPYRKYDKVLRKGYFRYDQGSSSFTAMSSKEFSGDTSNYHAYVKISRNGIGVTHQRYGKHHGPSAKDNAACILFPFQEIQQLHDQNENANPLYFYSISKSDRKSGGLFKTQKQCIVVTPMSISGKSGKSVHQPAAFGIETYTTGPLTGVGANLGSLCPVNCQILTYRLQDL